MKWKTKQVNIVYPFFAKLPHFCNNCKSWFWLERGFYIYYYTIGMFDKGLFEATCQDCGPGFLRKLHATN